MISIRFRCVLEQTHSSVITDRCLVGLGYSLLYELFLFMLYMCIMVGVCTYI